MGEAAQEQTELTAYLQSGKAGWPLPVERVDTHAAHVFLAGDRAWKLKRAVDLGYLDFSTVEKRHDALAAELELNSRTAPGMYRALHPVTRREDGGFRIGGDGAAVDWLLEMRRFPAGGLLSHMAKAGPLDEPMLLRLADRIAAFHRDAAIAGGSGADHVFGVIEGNLDAMLRVAPVIDREQARALHKRHMELAQGCAAMLDLRAARGRARHCHGDLHLANIAMVDGEPTPFDCLEFSEELATTDVLYDLAFLLMDLWQMGLKHEASLVFNRYLDRSGVDEDGVAAMPLFLSMRAAIRAHVAGAQAGQSPQDEQAASRARSYMALARELVQPVPARVVAVGGLSGTGKSTLARAIADRIGRPPGARVVRSDVLRKRMAGVQMEERLPPSSYSAESSAAVYAEVIALASEMLSEGQGVVADAVFARGDERDAIMRTAMGHGAAFEGIWLEAPEAVMRRRVDARHGDASDADAGVVALQARMDVGPLGRWIRLSADGTPDDVAVRARAVLGL